MLRSSEKERILLQMKVFVRLFACLLCVVMLFSLVSCSNPGAEETPSGMMIASCYGADYRLYVPTTWVVNTSYGVSGAYRDLSRQSTVSVNRYEITDELLAELSAGMEGTDRSPDSAADRMDWFAENYCEAPIRSRALDGKMDVITEDCVATTLGEANARQYHYTALVNGTDLHVLNVIAELDGAFYVFSFTATSEMYDMCLSDVQTMLQKFLFADPYIPPDYAKKPDSGKDAPAGMKPCFGNDVAYRFYVPEDWEINMDESIYSAYVPSDRTSVSTVPYMPDVDRMSVGEYFEMSKDLMIKMAGEDGFELISDTEKADLGGRQATVYEYRFRVGGTFYRYRQYVAAYKSMIYSLTYTATEDAFDRHLSELDEIVSAFSFR